MKVRRPAKRALIAAGALLAASLLMPSHASASLAAYGGGPMVGGVSFSTPIPNFPNFGPDQWTFSGTVTGMVLNNVPAAYVGNVTVQASGGSPFASLEDETGGISNASADGRAPVVGTQGTMSCQLNNTGTLSGGYLRIGTTVEVTVSGPCIIDGYSQTLTWVVTGQFLPDPTNPQNGNGVSGPIYTADFVGSVQVYPGLPA